MDAFRSHRHVYRHDKQVRTRRWLWSFMIAVIVIAFLPWTQNIRARGTVTTLRQEQRPQEVNTILGGRLEKWFVQEGDFVQRGDTIAQLSEIKAEYLDPALLQRTREQMDAKQATMGFYKGKVSATASQIDALENGLTLKLQQLRNKLTQASARALSDSMEVIAVTNEAALAAAQHARARQLYDSGLIALTAYEQRNAAAQTSLSKRVGAENKYLASRQELSIIRLEFNALQQDYNEKLAKAESDRFGTLSQVAGNQGELAKLQNQYANYSIRNGLYYILAPQAGQVVRAHTAGIGEIVKEGALLLHIVPEPSGHAVELFVRPTDLPLLKIGQPVSFSFDGFPAIVFRGWPKASIGIFSGIVSAIESDISPNGKFRVLVREDRHIRPWPPELRIGTAASGIVLLKNVPVWYELWRNLNSFPPDYYNIPKNISSKEVK